MMEVRLRWAKDACIDAALPDHYIDGTIAQALPLKSQFHERGSCFSISP